MGIFLNCYENENDYAPYYSDRYCHDAVLLSLGSKRILRFKNKYSDKINFNLDSGSLLYFSDNVNKNFRHSVLKKK